MGLITLKHGNRHRADGSDPLEATSDGIYNTTTLGYGNLGSWDLPPHANPSLWWGYTEDFNSTRAGNGFGYAGNAIEAVSGTGTINTAAVGQQGGFGWLTAGLGTGGSTSDYAFWGNTSQSPIRLGGGEVIHRWRGRFSALSDGTDTYGFRTGIMDTSSGTGVPTDGVYLRYLSTTSANWLLVAVNNASETVVDTGIAVSTSNQSVGLKINAAGTSAQFVYLSNGIWIPAGSPVASNIPTGSGRETGFGFIIYRIAGTTNRTVTTDYHSTWCRFTSMR